MAPSANAQESFARDEIGAAYCLGVLDYLESTKTGTPHTCFSDESPAKCQTRQNSIIMASNNMVFMRERYRQFLVARGALGGHRIEMLKALQASGGRDAKACWDAIGGAWFSHVITACSDECNGAGYSEACRRCRVSNEPAACETSGRCSDPSRLPF